MIIGYFVAHIEWVGRVSKSLYRMLNYIVNTCILNEGIIGDYCRSPNCTKKVVAKILREAQREVKPMFESYY
jgi:hypothetical protein